MFCKRPLKILILCLTVYLSAQTTSWAEGPSPTDSVTLTANIPPYINVDIVESNWTASINPLQSSSIPPIYLTGNVATNAANPNATNQVIVTVQASPGSQPTLRRSPSDPYGIRVFFTGTIGYSPNNNIVEDQPMTPQFQNGLAPISLTGTVNTSSPRKNAGVIPWGELPPGTYEGALTITATLNQ